MNTEAAMDEAPLRIGGTDVLPGERVTLDLPVAHLYTHGELTMPVCVVRGRKAGPRLFVCAAIHGDEINGVEIIRRLLRMKPIQRLHGTLIAVPIVNVFGFISHSRYLPDRRDLNRSFPGSDKGSLAARLSELFMREVVSNSTHGIDLHTGAFHRSNLPQVRARLDCPGVDAMARAFGAPVIVDAELRDGSLRQAVYARNIPLVAYEGGEALRFDEVAIRAGLRGILGVMHALDMLPSSYKPRPMSKPVVALDSGWVRAPESGILRMQASLGAHVSEGDLLGTLGDPFGENEVEVRAPGAGIVIGRINIPLINEGDALFHIAQFERTHRAAETVEAFQAEYAVPLPVEPAEIAT